MRACRLSSSAGTEGNGWCRTQQRLQELGFAAMPQVELVLGDFEGVDPWDACQQWQAAIDAQLLAKAKAAEQEQIAKTTVPLRVSRSPFSAAGDSLRLPFRDIHLCFFRRPLQVPCEVSRGLFRLLTLEGSVLLVTLSSEMAKQIVAKPWKQTRHVWMPQSSALCKRLEPLCCDVKSLWASPVARCVSRNWG